MQVLAKSCESAVVKDELLPICVKLADDKTPNVRFNVAKTMQKIAPKLDAK